MTNVLKSVWRHRPLLAWAVQQIRSVEGDIFPEEIHHVRHSVDKRMHEYRAGRILVRRASRQLGVAAFPLIPDWNRCPRWPEGIVGSISHTDETCGAVVGMSSRYHSIGFDVEEIKKVRRVLWPTFCTPVELEHISRYPSSDQQKAAALIFSAKESFFKCHFYLNRHFIRFHDIEVILCASGKRFRICCLNGDLPPFPDASTCHGYYDSDRDLVFTLYLCEKDGC